MNEPSKMSELSECLLDLKQPLAKRTHTAFLLRTNGSQQAVDILSLALVKKEDSSLMRHELAYILGQIQNPSAIPLLTNILMDESEDVLVRHECAEALAAIGEIQSLNILSKFIDHPQKDIAETCKIGVELINWRTSNEVPISQKKGIYQSVDPAPPFQQQINISKLKEILIDASQPLFTRYRAMFSLRNDDTDESALALLSGFIDESALFRHEIAYVLGQMRKPITIDGLTKVLKNPTEHRMVRHEAAEALGAIGGELVESILSVYSKDEEEIVQQSCIVALDTIDYWEKFEESKEF